MAGSPEPERLDAILDQEEDIDYDFEPEPAPYQGSDMEEGPNGDSKPQEVPTADTKPEEVRIADRRPQEAPAADSKPEEVPIADSKPEDAPMLPAEASPHEAEDAAQHAKQHEPQASSKKAAAGVRRAPPRADARPARDERLRSEPRRPQSAPRQRSARGSRYFLLKSISLDNIEISVAQGIWATQKHNEEKLNKAFDTCGAVYLIFSVNGRGNFQGWARMTSKITHGQNKREANWQGRTLVGNTFRVEWQRRFDLGMSVTNHLSNPWNDGKPVRIGRDGQEMPSNVGQELVDIIEESAEAQHVPRPVKADGRLPAVRQAPARRLRDTRDNHSGRPAMRTVHLSPRPRPHGRARDPLPAAPDRLPRPPPRDLIPFAGRKLPRDLPRALPQDLPHAGNDAHARDTFHHARPREQPMQGWSSERGTAQPFEEFPEQWPTSTAHSNGRQDDNGYDNGNSYARDAPASTAHNNGRQETNGYGNGYVRGPPSAPLQTWSHGQGRQQPELSQGFAERDSTSRQPRNSFRERHVREAPASQSRDWSYEQQHPPTQQADFYPTADYSASLTGTDWSYHPGSTQQQQPMDYLPARHQGSEARPHVGPGSRHGPRFMVGSGSAPASEPPARNGYRGRPDRQRGQNARLPSSTRLPESRRGCSKRGRSRSFSPQRPAHSSKRGCRLSESQHQSHAPQSLLDFHSYEDYADYIQKRGRQEVEPWDRQ